MTDVCARNGSGAGTGLRYLLCGLGLLLALLTASCGNSTFTPGTPIVTLTAQPGHFTSYIVYIDQIYFTATDNSVATLPAVTQHVDLAHLPDNFNVYTLSPIQQGTYVSATFEINYSGAYITYDIGGQAYQAPPIDPATSAAAGVITVTVKFDPNHPLKINSQTSTPVALNIDLEASNIVSTASAGGLQTTVKPFWTATTVPAYDKPVYARGLYVLADKNNNSFVMNTRPLHDLVNSPFGALTVNVGPQTFYQINGTSYVGTAGLTALAGLQNTYSNLQIAVYGPPGGSNPWGSFANIQPSITASAVYVGSSLESTIEDQVSGFVAGVNGNVLTVQGASYVDHFGDLGFQQSVPVTIGQGTIISTDGNQATPNISSISVGQFVTVNGVGTSIQDITGVFNPTSLDATSGTVTNNQLRMQNSTFYGTVRSVSSGTMTVNMQSIDNYEPTAVNFTGTGAGGADATAANYVINTGSLDVSAIAPGALVKVDGMPTTFGSGPPYFTASAITPASQLDSTLVLQWSGTGSSSAFSTINGTALIVNLADTALQSGSAQVRTGPITTANLLTQPPPQLQITFNTGNSAEPPLYGVGSVALGESLFSDPSAFATQVQTVTGSNPVLKLVARGQYDPTTGTFSATSISINAK